MKLSKELTRVATYLKSDYYAIKRFLEELLEITLEQYQKENILLTLNILKKIPELVNLPHLSLREQYLFLQENRSACRFGNIFFLISQARKKVKFFKNQRGYHLIDELSSIIRDICSSKTLYLGKEIPEGLLGEGAYGIVFEETQGYVRKEVHIAEPFAKIYNWLANQDFAFYQQIPFVRIYSAQLEKTGDTTFNLVTSKEDEEYKVTLILDKVTPFEEYSKKLQENHTTRNIEYIGNIVQYYGDTGYLDKFIQDINKEQNTYLMPSSVNWNDFPLQIKPTQLIIHDLHPGNWGLYINKGTKKDPDRLVHIDLDFISFS